ncbi:MAG: hypothetical protein R2880_21280 [Deinococcales bacterium]
MSIIRKNFRLIFMSLMIVVLGLAVEASAPIKGQESLWLLLHARRVEGSAVGYAGVTPPSYVAFRDLWFQEDSLASNAYHLINHGTPAGKIYGLLLLRKYDAYEAALYILDNLDQPSDKFVAVQSGCRIWFDNFRSLALTVAAHNYVIDLPSSN